MCPCARPRFGSTHNELNYIKITQNFTNLRIKILNKQEGFIKFIFLTERMRIEASIHVFLFHTY